MSTQEDRASCSPQDWTDISTYLEPLDAAWRWGYCDAALRHRVVQLGSRATAGTATPAEIDELLMAWQLLRSFSLEYRLPSGA